MGASQAAGKDVTVESTIGSPLKKHRPSITSGDEPGLARPSSMSAGVNEAINRHTPGQTNAPTASSTNIEEEEL